MRKHLLALILGFAALLSTNTTAALAKDTFSIGIGSEFENLNPIIASQAATFYFLYMAWRPPVALTPDGKWYAVTIKEIPTLENKMLKRKGAGLEANFEVREGIKWGDGAPMTCEDFEFGWQVGKNKNVSNPNREPYENIKSVTWAKDNNLKCTIEFATAKYDYFMSFPSPLPKHLEEPILKKYGDKAEGYDKNSLYTKDPTNPGLYFGPYVISEVKLGSHIMLTANPKYYGKKPYFKKIIIKYIPNTGTLEANLRSGNIDAISSAGGFSIDQASAFEKRVKAEGLPFKVEYEDGVIYAHIDLNLANPILQDLRVRKALSYGFNKKEIIDSFLEGRGKAAIHNLTDRDPWYTEKVTVYNYNKREAARLLDEAGWKVGTDGMRSKNGKPLELTIMGVAGVKLVEMIQTYLQNQYKALGIRLTIKDEPARVFFGETTTHRKFDMALYSWVSNPELSPRSNLHSKAIPSKENSWAGQNFVGYKNAEMDKLIEQLEGELSLQKRIPIAAKILDLYTKDIPVIPVYYRQNTCVNPAGLKGFRLSGHQYYESLAVEDWSM